MTPKKCRELADYIQEHTYDSTEQRALVADIRAGRYTMKTSADPLHALLISLEHINAPQEVVAHVKGTQFVKKDTNWMTAEKMEALQQLSEQTYGTGDAKIIECTVPAEFDVVEWYASEIIPDGEFVDALHSEASKRVSRAIINPSGGESLSVIMAAAAGIDDDPLPLVESRTPPSVIDGDD